MKSKILFLMGYFVVFGAAVFGVISYLYPLWSGTDPSALDRPLWQVISFASAFALIALCSMMLFVVRLIRFLVDIKINKENK